MKVFFWLTTVEWGYYILQVSEIGSLERRTLEVNRKRIKVVKPGSKTSFPTTEIRGTYAPPFHVSEPLIL